MRRGHRLPARAVLPGSAGCLAAAAGAPAGKRLRFPCHRHYRGAAGLGRGARPDRRAADHPGHRARRRRPRAGPARQAGQARSAGHNRPAGATGIRLQHDPAGFGSATRSGARLIQAGRLALLRDRAGRRLRHRWPRRQRRFAFAFDSYLIGDGLDASTVASDLAAFTDDPNNFATISARTRSISFPGVSLVRPGCGTLRAACRAAASTAGCGGVPLAMGFTGRRVARPAPPTSRGARSRSGAVNERARTRPPSGRAACGLPRRGGAWSGQRQYPPK